MYILKHKQTGWYISKIYPDYTTKKENALKIDNRTYAESLAKAWGEHLEVEKI